MNRKIRIRLHDKFYRRLTIAKLHTNSLKYRPRCGRGVTSLFLTQRARVRSPVGSISWLWFFRASLKCKTAVKKFRPHSSPDIIWPSYNILTIFICLRTATVSHLSCSTWPLLNNKQQQKKWIYSISNQQISSMGSSPATSWRSKWSAISFSFKLLNDY